MNVPNLEHKFSPFIRFVHVENASALNVRKIQASSAFYYARPLHLSSPGRFDFENIQLARRKSRSHVHLECIAKIRRKSISAVCRIERRETLGRSGSTLSVLMGLHENAQLSRSKRTRLCKSDVRV